MKSILVKSLWIEAKESGIDELKKLGVAVANGKSPYKIANKYKFGGEPHVFLVEAAVHLHVGELDKCKNKINIWKRMRNIK